MTTMTAPNPKPPRKRATKTQPAVTPPARVLHLVPKPKANDAVSVAYHLRDLLAKAERGELVGVAVAHWTPAGYGGGSISGALQNDIPRAHYAACRLVESILHYEECKA